MSRVRHKSVTQKSLSALDKAIKNIPKKRMDEIISEINNLPNVGITLKEYLQRAGKQNGKM